LKRAKLRWRHRERRLLLTRPPMGGSPVRHYTPKCGKAWLAALRERIDRSDRLDPGLRRDDTSIAIDQYD